MQNLTHRIDKIEADVRAVVLQLEDQMVHVQNDSRASRAQSTATFGSDEGQNYARGAGQPARVRLIGTPRADKPGATNPGGPIPKDAQDPGGTIPNAAQTPTLQNLYGTADKSEIVLLPFPSPSHFRTWRTTAKITIASCSANPRICMDM